MAAAKLSWVYQLFSIVLLSESVYSVSKRKFKEPEKPKEPAVHLSMGYQEIKSKLTLMQYKDFAEAATGHRRLFVHFSSSSDPEGLRALRGYYGAYIRLQQKELNITWGLVDCDTDRIMCQNQEVYYAPQYWVYLNKRRVNYTAGRSSFLVSEWIHKTLKYPGHFIDRRSDLKKWEKNEDRFFFYIGYMDQDYEFFKEIAASYPFYTWISCFDRDRLMSANGIYWYDNTINAQDMRNGPHGELVMQNFTLKYFNIIRAMSNWAMERIFVHERACVFLFYPDTNDDRGIQMPFWTAAMEFKWEIICLQLAIHDPEDNANVVHLMEMMGVTNPRSAAMRIMVLREGKWLIYQLRDRLTSDSMIHWYKEFKQGKLKPFYKSESPAEHKSNQMRKLVGKNFNKYVYNNDHDAVVIYHSPNCTVCDRLLKLGNNAVTVLSRYEDVRIYEINTWLNAGEDIPDRFMPQIHLLRKNDKLNPIKFTGLYTARDIIAWICDQTGRDNPYEEELRFARERQRGQPKTQDL